jgi:hypothetical protein
VWIDATPGATRYVRKRGGSLYAWTGLPLGVPLLSTATERPDGVRFRRVEFDAFALYVADDIELGDVVRIRRSPFGRGIEMTWRGGTAAPGGG